MGELPAFITDVPEESLSKRPLKPKPTRIRKNIFGDIQGAVTSKTIFTIPQDSVFEIRSIFLTMVASTANRLFEMTIDFGGGNLEEIFIFNLDHIEHDNHIKSFGENDLIIPSGELQIRKTDTQVNSFFRIVINGYLIKKEDVSEVFGILI